MADQATLRAQNDAAYARAQAYVGREDGWEQIHSEHGVTTWINRAEKVAKIHGNVNKAPPATLAFILGHIGELRQKYVRTAVSTEVLHTFEDKSRVIKEVNNYPTAGELATYKYGVPRPQADGSVHISVTSPEGIAEFPRGHSWLNFQLGIIAPHEGGSTITILTHPETSLELTEEQQNGVALELAHVYSNAARDLNEAA